MGVNENHKVKVKEDKDDKSQNKKPKELMFNEAERLAEEEKLEKLRLERELQAKIKAEDEEKRLEAKAKQAELLKQMAEKK